MIIKDESLGVYEIHHDGNNYTVQEVTGQNKQGDDIVKIHGYCSTMANAVYKVAKLRVEVKDSVFTLKKYVTELNIVKDEILKTINNGV